MRPSITRHQKFDKRERKNQGRGIAYGYTDCDFDLDNHQEPFLPPRNSKKNGSTLPLCSYEPKTAMGILARFEKACPVEPEPTPGQDDAFPDLVSSPRRVNPDAIPGLVNRSFPGHDQAIIRSTPRLYSNLKGLKT